MKKVVDDFNLNKWLGQEQARTLLMQAGFRGPAPTSPICSSAW